MLYIFKVIIEVIFVLINYFILHNFQSLPKHIIRYYTVIITIKGTLCISKTL